MGRKIPNVTKDEYVTSAEYGKVYKEYGKKDN